MILVPMLRVGTQWSDALRPVRFLPQSGEALCSHAERGNKFVSGIRWFEYKPIPGDLRSIDVLLFPHFC